MHSQSRFIEPTAADRDPLTLLLVRLARELGIEAEQMRAAELLRDARAAWPGEEADRWWKWLAEAGSSLGLGGRLAELSLSEALQQVRDGAMMVSRCGDGTPLVLLAADGRRVEIAEGQLDRRVSLSPVQLRDRLPRSSLDDRADWLAVEAAELAGVVGGEHGLPPLQRLYAILRPESGDVGIVVLFAFFVGLLSLATPLAVEALVNTVAFGRFLQPVMVLSLLLFAFLALRAAMVALQTFVVEIIQRRLFARVAADLAYRLPRVREEAYDHRYGPELFNRFFDIVTLQKVAAHLLLDGVAIVLTTVVGMAVLAFYHPWLLGFDVLLLFFAVGGFVLLGRGAIRSGIAESKFKYRIAAWFQDVARCRQAFKLKGAADFALDRANYLTSHYLASRRRHFHILFRQILLALGLQVLAATVLLGFGGWLVIQGQLTLGQLVAAELIVAMILGSLAKFGKHLEGFYDMTVAVDKLGQLFDLPMERQDGLLRLSGGTATAVRMFEVKLPLHSPEEGQPPISIEIEPGQRVALVGPPGCGKSSLLDLLYGCRRPRSGHVEIDGLDPLDMRPDVLRSHIVLVRQPEVFAGTLAENVHLHRTNVSSDDVRQALKHAGLLDTALRLPDGLETTLTSSGAPLSGTQIVLLMLARGLAGSPRLLLIDGVLDALPDDYGNHLMEVLAENRDCTLIIATGRQPIRDRCDAVIDLTSLAPAASTFRNGQGREGLFA